ncbi:23202_t:CDS:2, partial [Gigaspora rosea]
NIKVCNEKEKVEVIKELFTDEFNLEEFGITSKNVSIEQMFIKKHKKLNDFYKKFEEFKKITEKIVKNTKLIEKSITVVPRAITFAETIEVSMQIPDALNLFYETKNELFFQQVITDKYKQVIDEINELEDYYYILIDCGFKEIEIFTDLIIKDEKSKKYLKKTIKQETDFGKNVAKIIYQNYMINMKSIFQTYIQNNDTYICKDCCKLKECNDENFIVAKYKKESSMLDYLFKQQAKKLQEEIKDIEEYECHKRIIKELIESQDIDIVIAKYSITFTHWAETIERIKQIAEAIKNIKDNNKFKN